MLSNLEITAVKQTGVLGKIAVFFINKGFKIVGQSSTELDDKSLCLFKFDIESKQQLSKSDFEYLIKEIPQVIKIDDHPTITEIPEQEQQIDLSPLINDLGNQLVNRYPDIIQLLKKIDYSLSAEIRKDVLSKLGKGLGQWQSQNKYSLGGLLCLDKTLHRILSPSLSEFLDVEYRKQRITVNNCPHCFQQEDHTPGCFFITAYIQGFINSFSHLPETTVHQIHSKANGHQNCVFEIRLNNDNQS